MPLALQAKAESLAHSGAARNKRLNASQRSAFVLPGEVSSSATSLLAVLAAAQPAGSESFIEQLVQFSFELFALRNSNVPEPDATLFVDKKCDR